MKHLRNDVKELFNGVKFYQGKLDGRLDVRLFRSLNNSILRTQVNGEETLYFSGKHIGKEFGKNIEVNNMDGAIESINGLLVKLNLGHIKNIMKRGNKFILHVEDCPLCDPGKDSRCYFSAGLLAGLVSAALGKNVVGKETDCKSRKKDICTFELKFI